MFTKVWFRKYFRCRYYSALPVIQCSLYSNSEINAYDSFSAVWILSYFINWFICLFIYLFFLGGELGEFWIIFLFELNLEPFYFSVKFVLWQASLPKRCLCARHLLSSGATTKRQFTSHIFLKETNYKILQIFKNGLRIMLRLVHSNGML